MLLFQVVKHISGKTTTQEENVLAQSLQLPHLTFCSRKPYRRPGVQSLATYECQATLTIGYQVLGQNLCLSGRSIHYIITFESVRLVIVVSHPGGRGGAGGIAQR